MKRLQSGWAPVHGRRDGFTLIEVMLAFTLLAIGLTSVFLMQLHAMSGGRKARDTTSGALVARDQMERFLRMDWDDVNPTAGWVADAPVMTTVQASPANVVEQTYRVEHRIRDVKLAASRAVDVRVSWDEPNRPNKQLVISSYRYNF